jgi:ribosomal-protein-alanine N-acetyltransferase
MDFKSKFLIIMRAFPIQQPILRTERLCLRPFDGNDALALQKIANDFAVADTTLAIEHPFTLQSAREWLNPLSSLYDNQIRITWAITSKDLGALMGMICLIFDGILDGDAGEMGFWLGSAYWKHGYATEAGKAVLEFAFEGLEVDCLEAYHCTRNPRSGNVLRKIGFEWFLHQEDALIKWDKSESIEVYRISGLNHQKES